MQPLPEDLAFLEHFGVRGMHWGVRKNSSGVPKATDRMARKDAEEFARAKLFFGKGAGTRRKLIKAQVESKSKKDPLYAKAFDHHLQKQDLGEHAVKARGERKRTDRKEATKQTAGAVARRFTGEMGTKAAFVGVAVAGAAFLKSPKGQQITKKAIVSVKVWAKSGRAKKTEEFLVDFFKRQA